MSIDDRRDDLSPGDRMVVHELAPSEDGDSHPDSPLFIVGIGASAGGLEALEQFFRNMPADSGMAYVVVQHLSPDFESLMDKLLARETTIPIRLIEDGIEVAPNSIYLLPPGKEVIISGGRLLLAARSRSKDLSFPIDNFFRSLAQDAGPRSIALVLSGTGTDGSRGIRDIHMAGGLVIAQSESSAKFDGMPRSACDTGIVDMVLAPSEIPGALQRYLSNPFIRKKVDVAKQTQYVEGPIFRILSLLKNRYKIDFTDYKTTTISRRIERRIMLSGSLDLEGYGDLLREDPQELDSLYKDLLIGVTGFFRDRKVFEHLSEDVIPQLLAALEPHQELRAWVVGAATGEEAFSLAILLQEAIERAHWPGSIKIFASDVHPESLDFASRGVYSEESISELTEERRDRFFVRRPDGYHICQELRRAVVFVPHNVIKDAPFTNLDLITCRNVFIYFTPATQKKVLSLFHFGLKTGGVLCLGSSESPGELADEFEPVSDTLRIYKKRRDIQLPAELRMPVATFSQVRAPRRQELGALSHVVQARDLVGTYDRLLDEFMPPSLLVSDNRQLLHSFGDSTRYLHHVHGRPSVDVLDLVDPGIRNVLSAALRRVSKDRSPVTYAGIQCEATKEPVHLRMTVKPLSKSGGPMLVILQNEHAGIDDRPNAPVELQAGELSSREFDALERELQETKDSLQSTIEELQTTNEELQAANEQLTASNEELQSTNEELHSVNEELYTVNAEYQRKIDELTELTDDMDNLLNSTNVHTIFLDSDLCIRRFTPGIRETFNLIAQDIGRRFDSFTHNIEYDGLANDVHRVAAEHEAVEREVQDRNENWYLLRVLPYVSQGKAAGAVITLIDITSLKQAEARLAELSEIVEHSQDAIFRCDLHGFVRTWNRGARTLFGYNAGEVLGKHVSMLNLTKARHMIDEILGDVASGKSIDHFQAQPQRRDDSIIHVSLTLSPISDVKEVVVGASVVARDVTTQKRAEAEVREAVQRRDKFMAMLSHELRNPLAAVLNATTVLSEQGLAPEDETEAREVIEHNVRHVARMLDDLLDVARITNDKINLHREVVDVKSLMFDVVECVQHHLDQKKQELHVDVPEDSLYVEGDVGRLQQAQVNLLVNASKYTQEQGRIDYSLQAHGDQAVIAVRDNGEGIPSELLHRIFEPFVQSDQTLDRSQGGMGLGLTVVSKIIDGHGGSVTAVSDGHGKGSEFTCLLPLTNKRLRRVVEKKEAQVCGVNLLVVEDNPSVRRMLVRAMRLKGFEVQDAATGQEALDVLQGFQPDVAVIDIGLPDIDGYELARQIRHDQRFRQLLLVALTGYGRQRDIRRAHDAGYDLHLVKPLDPHELVRAIATAEHDLSSQFDSDRLV